MLQCAQVVSLPRASPDLVWAGHQRIQCAHGCTRLSTRCPCSPSSRADPCEAARSRSLRAICRSPYDASNSASVPQRASEVISESDFGKYREPNLAIRNSHASVPALPLPQYICTVLYCFRSRCYSTTLSQCVSFRKLVHRRAGYSFAASTQQGVPCQHSVDASLSAAVHSSSSTADPYAIGASCAETAAATAPSAMVAARATDGRSTAQAVVCHARAPRRRAK